MNVGTRGLSLRILIFLMGSGLTVFYALMLIVVASGLPASWVGLIYVAVGLSAGVACVVFYFHQSRFWVLTIGLGVLQSLIFVLGILLAGGTLR